MADPCSRVCTRLADANDFGKQGFVLITGIAVQCLEGEGGIHCVGRHRNGDGRLPKAPTWKGSIRWKSRRTQIRNTLVRQKPALKKTGDPDRYRIARAMAGWTGVFWPVGRIEKGRAACTGRRKVERLHLDNPQPAAGQRHKNLIHRTSALCYTAGPE